MPKISVIVPVYKVEEYIKKCLDSIISQTLRDIEIIVLNDGSPDMCEEIILQYVALDNRIIYEKHENVGLGPTRNLGIKRATGDYLAFIDSDDYIERDMLEVLYNKAIAEQADVVCAEIYMQYYNRNYIRRKFNNLKTLNLNEDLDEKFFKNYYFGRIYSHNAVDKIYKTNFIKKNNIIFGDNKIIFAEDNYFQFQTLIAKPRISFVDKPLYHYFIREGSIMNSYKNDLIVRHLKMVEDFKTINSSTDLLFQKVIDIIAFDGLIAEVINIVDNGRDLADLKKSFQVFYNSEIYSDFIKSVIFNKSYLLEPNRLRRYVLYFSVKLFRYRGRHIVERILYVKYKYFR
jgi:glycosyltransferase involved in cell wall biosynthesis